MQENTQNDGKRTYLDIPYEERKAAFRVAGKLPDGSNALDFDKQAKSWYAKEGADLKKLNQWLPDPGKRNKSPEEQFQEAMEAAGLKMDTPPIMDGKIHRVSAIDDKPDKKSGAYRGYLDGHPAGWYQNYKLHEDPVKWKASGKTLPEFDLNTLREAAEKKRQARDAEQSETHSKKAVEATAEYERLPAAKTNNDYLKAKKIRTVDNVKQDEKGRLTIPLYNENNEIRSLQRISPNGSKSLMKDAEKSGNFFVVGDKPLKNGEPFLYAEGYSTAASVHQATKLPVVMTIDSGNMKKVAEKLAAKYPESQQVVIADDDHHLKTNKGLKVAQSTAEAIGATYIKPKFNAKETEQGLTDFNDLHQSRGIASVRKQLATVLENQQTRRKEMDQPSGQPAAPTNTQAANANTAAATKTATTEKIDKVFDDAMNSSEKPKEKEAKSSKAETKTTEKAESKTPASNTKEAEEENSIEPNIENEAAADIKKWLKNRQTSAQMLEKERAAAKNKYSHLADASNDVQRWKEKRKTAEEIVNPNKAKTSQLESADDSAREWLKKKRTTLAEMLGEEQQDKTIPQTRRHLEIDQQAKSTGKAEKTADPFTEVEFKPAIPDHIKKSYVEMDSKYYFADKPENLAFVDHGAKLQTKLSTPKIAESLVDIAEARGWNDLKLKGTNEFKREAWLQATARGLETNGYTPKEEDLVRLKLLTEKRPTNQIETKGPTEPKPESGMRVKSQPTEKEQPSEPKPESGMRVKSQAPKEQQPSEPKPESGMRVKSQPAEKEQPSEPKPESGMRVKSQANKGHELENPDTDLKKLAKEKPELINEISVIQMADKFSQGISDTNSRNKFMQQVRQEMAQRVNEGTRTNPVKVRETQTERVRTSEKQSEAER